jgi:hypothetical protein
MHVDWGATMQGKQAKMVSPLQERAMLGYLPTTRPRTRRPYESGDDAALS